MQLSSLLNNGAVFVSYLIRTKHSPIKVWMPVSVIVTTLKTVVCCTLTDIYLITFHMSPLVYWSWVILVLSGCCSLLWNPEYQLCQLPAKLLLANYMSGLYQKPILTALDKKKIFKVESSMPAAHYLVEMCIRSEKWLK